MANLTVVARFTIDKAPATGLTLAEIDLYLTAVNKTSGAETVIWDGTENPSAELTGQGAYLRAYSAADFETYDYLARAVYTGATVLDSNYSYGAASETATQSIADEVLKRGAVNVQDDAEAGSLTELILAAFESSISDTTWTIRKTGGTTFNTRTVTLDEDALPVAGVT